MAPISPSANDIAGYAYVVEAEAETYNATLRDGAGHYVLVNGTWFHIVLKKPYRDSEINELLYVIIVIVFYATALMTLIITQIKRQRREGTDVDYYDEYLQRNQEVKRTCQTATTIVLKTATGSGNGGNGNGGGGGGEKATSGSGSVATATTASTPLSVDRGSSASLLEPPSASSPSGGSPRARSPQLRHSLAALQSGRGAGAGGGNNGGEDAVFTYHASHPSISPRELSPMLESIPDIGT